MRSEFLFLYLHNLAQNEKSSESWEKLSPEEVDDNMKYLGGQKGAFGLGSRRAITAGSCRKIPM
jgi:hypothetical protein